MQGLQGDLPTFIVVIIAVAAFLAGSPVTDPAEQLRLVMGARFEKRRFLSRSEAHVLYAAEKAINTADLKWRVILQVSLGEVLSSRDA